MLFRSVQRFGTPALLLCGDELLPRSLAELEVHPYGSHALALLLDAREGETLRFGLEPRVQQASPSEHPDALEFLRWWLAGGPTLRRTHETRAWTWSRT